MAENLMPSMSGFWRNGGVGSGNYVLLGRLPVARDQRGGGASMNGRNLLRFTGHPIYAGDNTAANRQLGWCRWNSAATIERTDDGIRYTHNAASSILSGFVVPLISETLLQGGEDEVLTLSFQYRGNLAGKTALYLLANTGGNVQLRTNVEFAGDETEWHTFTDTVYFPTLGTRYATALLVPYSRDGKWLEIKDSTMKLEYGTTATPWRAAPEDTEQPSDLVYASEGVDLGDTSGDKLIANINLAGDTAKISAAHVEVTGEAVFSAINNDTGTTKISGGKIDADTLHVKAANIDGSLAIGKVSGLQDSLDGKADDADVTAVSANLEVANGRITTLVEGLEQSSYFQQTEDGFTFAIDSAISTVAQAAGNAQDSADSAATAAAAAAQAAEDASRVARDYLTFQNGELTIGTSESDIRSVLTNVKFAFKTDAGDIAYFGLNSDGIWQMHIATAYMDDMLRFGDYAWIKRDNGNMSIKWLGA